MRRPDQLPPRGRRHAVDHVRSLVAAGAAREFYRRLTPSNHAPTNLTWGLDNRSASIRVITAGRATRVEHRVAGADCNPYLAIAGILAGGLHGLRGAIDPGPPIPGRGTRRATRSLPINWDDAIDAFDASDVLGEYLGLNTRIYILPAKDKSKPNSAGA